GVLAARGASILFADADGATRFSDIAILEPTTATTPPPSHRRKDPSPDHPPLEPLGIAVGSRAFLQDSEVKRSLIRSIMMYLFHAFVRFIGIRTLQDTQCGFKLFTRAAAQRVFPHLHSQRWVFDIELLLLAQWAAIPVAEVAVAWHEVPGTKLRLMNDTLRMAIDLLLIRFNYLAGIW
ncbi:asparagine-linked glycosylation 5-like protein, isoform CRA_c, partial [Caulochytrium protostelioides]